MLDWQGELSHVSVEIGDSVSGPLMICETVSTDVRAGAPFGWPLACNQSRKALSVSSSIGP